MTMQDLKMRIWLWVSKNATTVVETANWTHTSVTNRPLSWQRKMKRSKSTSKSLWNHCERTHTTNETADARSPNAKPQKLPAVQVHQVDAARPRHNGLWKATLPFASADSFLCMKFPPTVCWWPTLPNPASWNDKFTRNINRKHDITELHNDMRMHQIHRVLTYT